MEISEQNGQELGGEQSVRYSEQLDFLRQHAKAIEEAGPKKGEQLISQWRSVVAADPSMAVCTPISVLREMVLANRLDVDFGTRALGEAFMECRYNKREINGREIKVPEARLGLMYAGRLKIALRNGAILDAFAHPVFDGDEIEIHKGTEHRVVHRPNLRADQTFANMIGCYAVVTLPDVGPRVTWLEKKKINAAAEKGTSKSGPWFHDYESVEMARKVALNNALKYVPRSGADLHPEEDPGAAADPKSSEASGVAQRLLEAASTTAAPIDMRTAAKPEPAEAGPAPTAPIAPKAGAETSAGVQASAKVAAGINAAKAAGKRAGRSLSNGQALELWNTAVGRYRDSDRAMIELEDGDWTKTIDTIAGNAPVAAGGGR